MSNFSSAILSDHARLETARRGISEADIRAVLDAPQAVLPVREGRVVAQREFSVGDPPKAYLMRVFVDVDRTPVVVVTAYRTSKLTKYKDRP